MKTKKKKYTLAAAVSAVAIENLAVTKQELGWWH